MNSPVVTVRSAHLAPLSHAFRSPAEAARRRRVKATLLVLAGLCVAACTVYLTWNLRGNWSYALDLRSRQLGALVVVGVAVGVSSLVFQTVSGSRILTPGVMGFDALYSFIQTVIVFTLGAGTLQLLGVVEQFLLAELLAHLGREQEFLGLAAEGALLREVHDLDVLLGDRGAAAGRGHVRRREADQATFIEAAVTATLIFCVGPLAIIGSISDGLGNGAEQLIVKAVMDGFAAIAQLPPPRPPIVFVTAHAEHAAQAFEIAATDYLVKPVSAERLADTLRRIRERDTPAPALSSP